MKLEIDFDKLSKKRRKAVLDALFDGLNELDKEFDKVLSEANHISRGVIEEEYESEEAQEKLDKLFNDNKALIVERKELERLGSEVWTYSSFKVGSFLKEEEN